MSPRQQGQGKRRWPTILATVAVATVLVGGGSQLIPDETVTPPATGTANLWIDTNGGTCARSSTARVYSGAGDTASCSSLSSAYAAAAAGDLVLIRAGTYGNQNVTSPRSLAQRITFEVDAGAVVNIGGLYDWMASNSTIDGSDGDLNIEGFHMGGSSSCGSCRFTQVQNVTVSHADMRGAQVQILNISNLLLSDVDIGGHCSDSGGEDGLRFNDPTGTSGDANDPVNVTIEGSRIGDICYTDQFGTAHPDCIAASAGHNITLRGNKLCWWAGSQGVYFRADFLGGTLHDWTIENNQFGNCWKSGSRGSGCTRVLFLDAQQETQSNFIIRHNSFITGAEGSGIVFQGPNLSNIQVYGNTGRAPDTCTSGVTFANNVWEQSTCGATDIQGNPGFVNTSNGPGYDLHLSSTSSPACNRGGATYPTTDYDGEARPTGSAAEAGADEKAGC